MGVEAPATTRSTGDGSPPLPGEDAPLETLVDEALRARPDVAALDGAAARAGADEQGDRAAATALPSPATTGFTYNGRRPGRPGLELERRAVAGLAIFEGGLVRATVREGRRPVGGAARRRSTSPASRSASTSTRPGWPSSPPRRRSRRRSARSRTRKARLDLAEVRYRTGVGNSIELSDAQLAATNAAFQRLQATLQLDTARAQLLKALGRPSGSARMFSGGGAGDGAAPRPPRASLESRGRNDQAATYRSGRGAAPSPAAPALTLASLASRDACGSSRSTSIVLCESGAFARGCWRSTTGHPPLPPRRRARRAEPLANAGPWRRPPRRPAPAARAAAR